MKVFMSQLVPKLLHSRLHFFSSSPNNWAMLGPHPNCELWGPNRRRRARPSSSSKAPFCHSVCERGIPWFVAKMGLDFWPEGGYEGGAVNLLEMSRKKLGVTKTRETLVSGLESSLIDMYGICNAEEKGKRVFSMLSKWSFPDISVLVIAGRKYVSYVPQSRAQSHD